MRAIEVYADQGAHTVRPTTRPVPAPGPGEVLVRVQAAGVIPTELLWYPTHKTKSGTPRDHAVPCHEFAGTVAGLGEGVSGFSVGDSIYGMNDWFAEGAAAEFTLTGPSQIAPAPPSLSPAEAASVPISALTAWQGLFDKAALRPSDHVLIHGAAGAVGLYAVQLARRHGARITATASARDSQLLASLGAGQVVDYRIQRFEDFGPYDVIFDAIGGETLERSFAVLGPGGRIVSIASGAEGSADPRVKEAFFIVEPNAAQLAATAELLSSGDLVPFVKAELPLDEAHAAFSGTVASSRPGKVVLTL